MANLFPAGVNPRGLRPNEVWQMDVTDFPEFGCFRHLHVTTDTCSGFLWAVAQSGQTAMHYIKALCMAIAVMGAPHELKTDNDPAYRNACFGRWCTAWGIKHIFSIPGSSTCQAIMECAHQTLKGRLCALKEGGGLEGPELCPHALLLRERIGWETIS